MVCTRVNEKRFALAAFADVAAAAAALVVRSLASSVAVRAAWVSLRPRQLTWHGWYRSQALHNHHFGGTKYLWVSFSNRQLDLTAPLVSSTLAAAAAAATAAVVAPATATAATDQAMETTEPDDAMVTDPAN